MEWKRFSGSDLIVHLTKQQFLGTDSTTIPQLNHHLDEKVILIVLLLVVIAVVLVTHEGLSSYGNNAKGELLPLLITEDGWILLKRPRRRLLHDGEAFPPLFFFTHSITVVVGRLNSFRKQDYTTTQAG